MNGRINRHWTPTGDEPMELSWMDNQDQYIIISALTCDEFLQDITGGWTDPNDQCIQYRCYAGKIKSQGSSHECYCPEVNS